MKQRFLFLFVALVSILASCKEPVEPTVEPTLTVQSTLNFTADGGQETISVESNTNWVVTAEDAEWLSFTPTSAEGNTQITFSATENTDTQARKATVTITAQTISKTISVSQLGTEPSSGTEDSGNFSPAYIEMVYDGNYISSNTVTWAMYLYDENFTNGNDNGVFIKLQLLGDPNTQTFRDGHPVGEFSVGYSSEYVAGEIVESGYTTYAYADYLTYFLGGSINIEQTEGNNYKFTAQFDAEDNTTFEFEFTRDITNEEIYSMQDASYFSDLESDHTQQISDIFIDINGDILSSGNNVCKLHIWGDGATVNATGNPTNGEGSYLVVQFYVPLDNEDLSGTYTIGSSQALVTNTVEPGCIVNDTYAGTWFYEFWDANIIGMTPASSGEVTLTKNPDGQYTVSYRFGDDNPYGETKYFSGDYTGAVTISNRVDTGDFDDEASSFTYYADQICENHTWELRLVSKEYVSSGGSDGFIAEFLLNTSLDDSYYVDITDKTWRFNGGGTNDNYTIYSGTVTTYTNGVESSSDVNGGIISVVFATNSNYTFEMNLTNISTLDGNTYTWDYFSEILRTDGTVTSVSDINVSDLTISTSKLEYYGFEGGYTNWVICLYNDAYDDENATGAATAINLPIFLEGDNYPFEDGMPEGTFEYIPGSNAEGIWSDWSLIRRGSLLYEMVSGTVKVERLEGDEYRFTYDIQLDIDDAKLVGVYQGVMKHENWGW